MTVASNICVYLIAMAFFGLGDSGTELSDQVFVEFRLTRKQCFGSGSVSGSVDMDPGSAKN